MKYHFAAHSCSLAGGGVTHALRCINVCVCMCNESLPHTYVLEFIINTVMTYATKRIYVYINKYT